MIQSSLMAAVIWTALLLSPQHFSLNTNDKQQSQTPEWQSSSADEIRIWVDKPGHQEEFSGNTAVNGWAIATRNVKDINFRILNSNKQFIKMLAGFTYGMHRLDVCRAISEIPDSNCPLVGWKGYIDTKSLANGNYYLRVAATDKNGHRKTFDRAFKIQNTTTGGGNPTPNPPTSNCNSRSPGQLMADLGRVVKNQATQCNWQKELNLNFNSWRVGSSNNLPVVAAAIGLFYYKRGNKKQQIISWWKKYLRAELGNPSAGMPAVLKYYGSSELNSSIYQFYNLDAVVAAHYWASKNNDSQLLQLCRQYLRVAWAMFALSASNQAVKSIHHDNKIIQPSPRRYNNPVLALAGARSDNRWVQYWLREFLFYRAVKWPRSNVAWEQDFQRNVLDYLERHWQPQGGYSVYGLKLTEATQLRQLVQTGRVPSFLRSMLGNIRSIRPYHIIGWPGVRFSLMEGNPNRNTAPTYGMVYFQKPHQANGQELHVLYPWTAAKRKGITEGRTTLNLQQGYVEASNHPGSAQHPLKTVRISNLPRTQPLFHLILSPSQPPVLK